MRIQAAGFAGTPARGHVPNLPGQTRTIQLVALAGDRVVYGFQGKVMGALKAKYSGQMDFAKAGAVIKLQAGGFASEAAARAACGQLSAGGQTCIAVNN